MKYQWSYQGFNFQFCNVVNLSISHKMTDSNLVAIGEKENQFFKNSDFVYPIDLVQLREFDTCWQQDFGLRNVGL
jgi:hypothetical protein